MDAEHLLIMAEGAVAGQRELARRGAEPLPELDRLVASLPDLEWSGTREGQGNGPMSSGPGPLFPACPVCGGLKEPNGHFIQSAVGHRSGCRLAALLGSPTVAPEDGQERMPV